MACSCTGYRYMIVINSGPGWFYGYDAIFELVCMLVTFLISVMSYRAYRFINERKYYNLFASFLLISFAFALGAAGSFLMHLEFYDRIISILNMFDVIFLGQIALTLLAYTMLLLASMNVRSRRLTAFVMSLMVLFIVFSYQYYFKYHLILLLLLFFLAVSFYMNYRRKKSFNSALVFSGFYLLLLAQPFFFLSPQFSQNYYILGNVLQALGFLALFCMIIRITGSK